MTAPIGPAPLPVSIGIGHTDPPQKLIVMVIKDVTGERYVFLDQDLARTVAQQLTHHAQAAGTGLIVPQPKIPPSGGLS